MDIAAKTVSIITRWGSRNDDARRDRAGFQRGVRGGKRKQICAAVGNRSSRKCGATNSYPEMYRCAWNSSTSMSSVQSPRRSVGPADLAAILGEVEISAGGEAS